MNSKFYKYCVVPHCERTSIKTSNKLFIYVPNKEGIRNKWLKLAGRDPIYLSTDSRMYFCEDHFDLPNDMENYMEYHIMGFVSQIRLKPGCIPSKFECQPSRQKRICCSIKQRYVLQKQKKMTTEECLNESIPCTITSFPQSSVQDTSNVDSEMD